MPDLPDPIEAALVDQARLLVQRLERISVDSIWARRSSGHRGALLRWVERFDQPDRQDLTSDEVKQLAELIDLGFYFLNRAAGEKSGFRTNLPQE